jgi:general stress protein 26
MDLIKEAEIFLEKRGECAVSSVTEKGYPRICILKKLRADGCKTIYFSTGTSSKKIAHYKKNPKAGVTYFDENDSVTLLGNMNVVEDKKIKDALWSDWMAKHFPNGGKDDAEYAVIRFDAEEATIYIKGRFETIRL